MLRSLRDPSGGPAPHVRLVAILVIAGLVLAVSTAIFPVLRWLLDAVF